MGSHALGKRLRHFEFSPLTPSERFATRGIRSTPRSTRAFWHKDGS